ncbi:hypothetical protein ACRALDRAFT_1072277 [Sodiomyces alcalophilus JCM 7366]|uniref:uncharacterized protein n=1 Tax=Sodiomyces alcalophilus JCM 7366 TaxID=591952 RepID=UPI0039B6BD8D
MKDDEVSENEWSDFAPDIGFFSSQRLVAAPASASGKAMDDSEDEDSDDGGDGGSVDDSDDDGDKDDSDGGDDGSDDGDDDADHGEIASNKDESRITDREESSESDDDSDDESKHEGRVAVNGNGGLLSDGTAESESEDEKVEYHADEGHAPPSASEQVNGDESDKESDTSGNDASNVGSENSEHSDFPTMRRRMSTDNDAPMTPPTMLRMAEKRKLQDEEDQPSQSPNHKTRRIVHNGGSDGATNDVYHLPPSSGEESPPPSRVRSTPGSSKRRQRAKTTFAESQSARKGKEPEKPPSTSRFSGRFFSSQPSSSKRLSASQPSMPLPSMSQPLMPQSPSLKASSETTPPKASSSSASSSKASSSNALSSKASSSKTPSSQPPSAQPSSPRPSSTRAGASGSRTRIFTRDEIERITVAVEKYRDDHKMTQKEVNELIQKRMGVGRPTLCPETSRLWALITAACPDKPRQKVIDFCRLRFHNFKARGGHWTPEEEEQLSKLVAQGGTKWAKWSQVLNRHPKDLRDRYRNYIICGDNRASDRWSHEEEALLRMHVGEAMDAIELAKAAKPDDPFYDRPVEQLIDWQEISSRLNRARSRLQCMSKWKQMLEKRSSST